MHYPLQLKFKLATLAARLTIVDHGGAVVLAVKQKLFKLKEAVSVYADEEERELRYTIQADRVLDFSAQYRFADADGRPLGAIRRHGMRSLWRAHYEIVDAEGALRLALTEENPWAKVLDGLLEDVPVLGLLSGYFLHPRYAIAPPGGEPVLRLRKEASLFERRFSIERLAPLDQADETRALLGAIMMVLLERERG